LLHPLSLLAAALIAFNDFYLKRSHPGLLSGKLSDFGLMFFFPVMLYAVFEWVLYVAEKVGAPVVRPRWLPLAACALGASYFSVIKLFAAGAALHVRLLETIVPSRRFVATPDPTDLMALLVVPVTWTFLNSYDRLTMKDTSAHGS